MIPEPTPVPTIAGPLFSEQAWSLLSQRLNLSDREQQISLGVIEDLKESAIARRLGMSVHTVHTHLERLYRKLGVGSRTQLVAKLAQRHLELTTEKNSPFPPICSVRAAGRCPLLKRRPNSRLSSR